MVPVFFGAKIGMNTINLRPYGMLWDLNPNSFSSVPMDWAKKINTITEEADGKFKTQTGNTYTKGAYIGGGSFGKVYDCVRESDGKNIVMKIIANGNGYTLVKESIIQIVIVELTKDIKNGSLLTGPFAPILYEIGYNPTTKDCYIFSEKMRQTTHALIKSRELYPDDQRKDLGRVLLQMSFMMSELWRLLKFNHRDFKSDNCMYIRDGGGAIQARLIDFGFSCIKFGNMQIEGGGATFRHCNLAGRDLTQYIYEIYKYHPYIPADMKNVFEKLLTFPMGAGGKPCFMFKKCGAGMKEWKDVYKFLNDDQIVNPNGTPECVSSVIEKFLKGEDWATELKYTAAARAVKPSALPFAGKAQRKPLVVVKPAVAAVPVVAKACPPDKILNPATGRCVNLKGKIGAALRRAGVAACPPSAPNYNPKTRRCLKACAAGKQRNATFKCIKPKVKAVAAGLGAAVKPCPADKPDLNPKTKRCLKACAPGFTRDAAFVCRSTRKAGRPRKP